MKIFELNGTVNSELALLFYAIRRTEKMKKEKKGKNTGYTEVFDYNGGKKVRINLEDELFEGFFNYTRCAICGNSQNIRPFKGKKICADCINYIKGA